MNKLIIAFTLILCLISIRPQKAQAEVNVAITAGMTLVGGLTFIMLFVLNGYEASSVTSGRAWNKKQALEHIQNDAFEFIAGESASAILLEAFALARKQHPELAEVSDIELARATLRDLEE